MSTLQTFFRAVVMLATLGLLAKAWYHYGPTVAEMQVIGTRAAQVAQEAWTEYWQTADAKTSLAADPRQSQVAPAPFVPPGIEPPPIHAAPAPATQSGPVQFAGGALPPTAPALANAPPGLVPMDAPVADARLPQMLERLASLGVREQELQPWGNSGRLYRFKCSAPLARSPSFSRHFEAVAETPEAAVEKVAAEIEAWHRGQQ